MIDTEIGKKIRSIRVAKGFSIYRLSKETDISQNHISGIELGKRQPTIETLERILVPLGVTLAEFFNENDEVLFPTQEERTLIENFRCLSAEKSAALLNMSELLK